MLVELLANALEERGLGFTAVLLLVGLPQLLLRLLKPGDEVGRIEGQLAVVLVGCLVFVEPAVAAEVLADLALEGGFEVDAHGLGGGVNTGRSRQVNRRRRFRPGIDAELA